MQELHGYYLEDLRPGMTALYAKTVTDADVVLGYIAPDRFLGVSRALQARYVGEGAYAAYHAPRVDLLIHFLYRDEPLLARFQSGLVSARTPSRSRARACIAVDARLAPSNRRAVRELRCKAGTVPPL